MVPKVAAKGRSFKGAGLYYLHDKQASTSERVAFTHTENLATTDAERALRLMAYTAMHQNEIKAANGGSRAGRKLAHSVLTYSLSWHPDENPTQVKMIEAGRETLRVLGMADHQAIMVAHTDEKHPHLHVIANRVHPVTGKAAKLACDHLKLSEWAEGYEREHGKIRCQDRVENNRNRQERRAQTGNAFVKHRPDKTAAEFHAERKARLKLAFDRRQVEEKNLSATHRGQRQALYDEKESRIEQRRREIRELKRPKWAELYRRQKADRQEMEAARRSAYSRLWYFLRHREMAPRTRGELAAEALRAVFGRDNPHGVLSRKHHAERAALAAEVREQTREALGEENGAYRRALDRMRQAQAQEKAELAQQHSRESQAAARKIRDGQRIEPARNEFARRVAANIRMARKRKEQDRKKGREHPGRELEP